MYIALAVLSFCFGLFDASDDWCYTGCEHTPSHWDELHGAFCGGSRQSPVNIDPGHVKTDETLTNFTFVNFSSREVFHHMENNGHTAKMYLKENMVEVHGGGLSEAYVAIQFHFHWGDTDFHPGSEHLVNGRRFSMEMHVVTVRKGLTIDQALDHPEGIAVLGFLIEGVENMEKSEAWSGVTSHLTDSKGVTVYVRAEDLNPVTVTEDVSMSDLIGDVDLTKFYRYSGSLTTPTCNEVVLWTVFEEPIHVSADLLRLFPTKTRLTNVYRPTQELNGRHVFASPAVQLPAAHSWCYDEHECDLSPEHWHTFAESCAGHRQSPIDINTNEAVEVDLGAFTFKDFDNKHAIDYIINTGHTVKCVLKEDLVEVSGGGLGHDYSVLQFHFHWANIMSNSTGSEHLIDSKRFPMEMHIVTKMKNLTLHEAVATGDGLAVLGFLVEASDETKNTDTTETPSHAESTESSPQSNSEAWRLLTSHFPQVKSPGIETNFTAEVSMDDLLGRVGRGSFYRYMGSLTTPTCNEAVVWTVFKDSIKVDRALMQMFQTEMGFHDVYRPTQRLHNRTVYHRSASAANLPTLLVLLLTCVFLLNCSSSTL